MLPPAPGQPDPLAPAPLVSFAIVRELIHWMPTVCAWLCALLSGAVGLTGYALLVGGTALRWRRVPGVTTIVRHVAIMTSRLAAPVGRGTLCAWLHDFLGGAAGLPTCALLLDGMALRRRGMRNAMAVMGHVASAVSRPAAFVACGRLLLPADGASLLSAAAAQLELLLGTPYIKLVILIGKLLTNCTWLRASLNGATELPSCALLAGDLALKGRCMLGSMAVIRRDASALSRLAASVAGVRLLPVAGAGLLSVGAALSDQLGRAPLIRLVILRNFIG